MAIGFCKMKRRQFLLGASKQILWLPLLPSLMPREVLAQTRNVSPRMMIFWYDHNNLNALWPSPQRANRSVGSDGAREISLRQLGSVVSHSPALSHSLYESIKNRDLLTYVRGLDIEHGAGHGNGGLAAAQDRESQGGFPTLDTVIESSSTVYPQNTPLHVRRALRVGANYHSDFYRKVGQSVERVGSYHDNLVRRFYSEVFGSLTTQNQNATPPPTSPLKANVLNQVYEAYARLQNNQRISQDDRARLTQHMDYISDIQRSFTGLTGGGLSPTCSRPADPGNVVDPARCYPLYMDLLSLAFRCGLTQFSVMKFASHNPSWIPGLNTGGRNFHDVMHGDGGATLQYNAKLHWWRYFANMIADRFLSPLQQEDGNSGRSYLENMITVLLCQGGWANPGQDGGHNGLDSQQILIGSMGGRLRSGNYFLAPRSQQGDRSYVGDNLPYNCFLITLLQLMGVPQQDYAYATPDGRGFGFYGALRNTYRHRFYQPINELMNG
jgi:hypothetical protein